MEAISGAPNYIPLSSAVELRAQELNQAGIETLDSLHLASAEAAEVDFFCTRDDSFERKPSKRSGVGHKLFTLCDVAGHMIPQVLLQLVEVIGAEGPVELQAAPPGGAGLSEVEHQCFRSLKMKLLSLCRRYGFHQTKSDLTMSTRPVARVGLHQAKTHFSELLRRVEAGEEITILRRGKAVARLVPSREPGASRPLGLLHGPWPLPPASDLVEPDPEIESLFYGEDG